MADSTFIGSTLSVYKGDAPASGQTTKANWGSSGTLIEVVNVQSVGELGDQHSPIEYNILKEGRVKRLPGAVDGGVVPVSVVFDTANDADALGQGIIRLGNGTDDQHQFLVVDSDTKEYAFAGTIADRRWATRDNTTVKMFTFNIFVSTPLYEVS